MRHGSRFLAGVRALAGGVALTALAFGALVAVPADAQDSEVRRIFNEGRDLFLKGEDEKALEKFEEVLRLRPDHAAALALREEAGYQFFIELLMKREDGDTGAKLQSFARFMLALAEREFDPQPAEQADIDRLVGQLEGSFTERWAAIEELNYRIGQQAAPALVKALGDDRNDALRSGAMHACIQMGTQIVPALLEAIESENQLLVQNCCAILGAIGDDRALAELKRVSEDGKQAAETRGFADRALERITGEKPTKLGVSAKELFRNKALLYLQDHPAIIKERDKRWMVWKWQDGALQSERVPRWLYHLRLAEEACYDAIDVDFGYRDIWPVMALSNLAEYLSVNAHVARSADDDGLKELLAKNAGGLVLGFPAGQQALFDALDIALKTQEPELAEATCDALAVTCDGKALTGEPGNDGSKLDGKSLIEALNYFDKRSAKAVRYAAAAALVAISDRTPALKAPGRKPKWADRTVEVLAEAVGESGTRTVLVIDQQSQNRRSMAEELTQLGYFVVEAGDVFNGLRRAKAFPSCDLILMAAELAHQETFALTQPEGVRHRETLIDSLRSDYRTAEIPIVIAVDAAGMERAKSLFENDAKGFVTRAVPPNKEELKAEMERVLAAHPSEMKSRADEMSARASRVLASIDPHFTFYPVGKAVPALVGVLGARPDSVRDAALAALARIGDGEAIPGITKCYADTGSNSAFIRAAAARAMGEVFLRSGAPLPTDTFDALIAGLNDPDADVELATGQCLGKITTMSNEQRYQAYKARRVNWRGAGAGGSDDGSDG